MHVTGSVSKMLQCIMILEVHIHQEMKMQAQKSAVNVWQECRVHSENRDKKRRQLCYSDTKKNLF